jgi:hypothetical protein
MKSNKKTGKQIKETKTHSKKTNGKQRLNRRLRKKNGKTTEKKKQQN